MAKASSIMPAKHVKFVIFPKLLPSGHINRQILLDEIATKLLQASAIPRPSLGSALICGKVFTGI